MQSTDCGRSDRSYPNLIAAQLELTLTDVSCGAATIPNVVDTAQGAHPPQIQSLTATTDLVTVTVGGNDIAYNGTALACSDPANECAAPADLDTRVAATGPDLVAMLDLIRSAAPEAVVVFVTYPREIPEVNCPELSLSETERALVADMGARLQQVFLDVAEQTGVVLVDLHPTALGHEVMAQMITAALSE